MDIKKKKVYGIVLSVILFSLLLTFLVSAQSALDTFKSFWEGLANFLDIIFSPILGTSAADGLTTGEVLFMKVLLFIIVLAIVWAVLGALPFFEDNTWVVVVISFAVSILSIRFIATPGWISTILLPYSVLGIALTAFLPLLIYFYFVEKIIGTKPVLRKTAWILAAVIFTGLWISRFDEISKFAGAGKFNPVWIYAITAGLCLICFIFDKTIRRAFIDSEMRAISKPDRLLIIADLRRKIGLARADVATGVLTQGESDKLVKALKKRLLAAESY